MSVSSTTSWTSRNVTVASDQIVAKWLFSVALLVALMVVIGGVTRLTGSGLSMVEWRPLMGTLPPMTTLEWQRVYQLYQASPEYQQLNYGMSLSNFKTIFFWEYLEKEKIEISKKLKEMGVEDTLINLKGMTQGMLVVLGEQNITKLKDFAELSSDELIGGMDEIKGKRIKINGYLEDFALTRDEADNMIMDARKIVFGN